MLELWVGRANFWLFIFLFLCGLYIMVTHHHLIKKLIGMYLVQTSIILFYISLSAKSGSTVPILRSSTAIQPEAYVNPLPHALMLTAIVVGIATLGVSLALVVKLYRQYRTMDEDEILMRLE